MANLKMLKMPKKPRLPKKPAASASVTVKQNWIRKVQDLQRKHGGKERAVFAENEQRKKLNEQSKKLSQVIAGIGDVMTVRPSSFKAVLVRGKRKAGAKKKAVSGVRKTAKKKAAPRKAAPKKKTVRRRY